MRNVPERTRAFGSYQITRYGTPDAILAYEITQPGHRHIPLYISGVGDVESFKAGLRRAKALDQCEAYLKNALENMTIGLEE